MRVSAATAGLSAVLALCATGARAQEMPVPETDVRVFAGEADGVGAQHWFAQRVRAGASAGMLTEGAFQWASADVVVLLVGTPRRFIGLRAGYQFEYNGHQASNWYGSRAAHAVDGGLVARLESARGSALEAQLGVEGVHRSVAAVCCDDAALARNSTGVRAALQGELAVWDQFALVAQAELRTGAHVMELLWLPTASLGVRYRF